MPSDSIACSMSQQCKHCKKCMVYLLTQLSTHLSCIAKAGQTATALPGCPALLTSKAILATWYHCISMQVTALQAAEMYGVSTHRIKHTLFAYYKGRADNNSPVRLPCPAVITCQRHHEPSVLECITQQYSEDMYRHKAGLHATHLQLLQTDVQH